MDSDKGPLNKSSSDVKSSHQTDNCKILPLEGQQVDNWNIDIILIPGVGTTGVELWTIRSPTWISPASATASKPRLLTFQYHISLNDQFSWRILFEKASLLLDCLYQHCLEPKNHERPLIFICHSLGGVILKQALSVANQQSRYYFGVLNLISGIVFLGTPHNIRDEKALRVNVLNLLKSLPNSMSKQTLSNLAGDAQELVNAADRFQDVTLRVDIASVWEKKETKIRQHRFGTKKVIIVGEDFARTRAPVEILFGIKQDHENLWKLDNGDGEPDKALQSWVKHVIANASTTIKSRLEAYRARTPPIESPSNTASDVSFEFDGAARHALQSAQGDSGNASVEAEQGSSTFGFDIVPIPDGLTMERRKAKLPCFMMDNVVRNSRFFGRQEILMLLDTALLPKNDATASSEGGTLKHIALCGMGGLGKTEIAIEYAYSRREKFDAIFWIRADEEANLELDFSRIATFLGLEDPAEPNNQPVNRELAKGWLANPKKLLDNASDTVGQSEANWLIILDNADNSDILDGLRPIFGSGSLLITTRDPLAKTAFSSTPVGIDLEPPSEKEAMQFLQQLVPPQANDSEDEARELVKVLGYLPLAITQMAGVIRKQFLPYSDFLKQYEDESGREDLHNLQLNKTWSQTARGPIASIFAIDRLSPEARTLLELSSFLNPDCIQERIFLTDALKDFPNFPRKTAAWNAARGELIQASLVKRNDAKRELRIHRVLRDSVRAKMAAEKTIDSFAYVVDLVSTAWPRVTLDKRHTTDRWQQCEEIFPHVLAFKNYYEKRFYGNSIDANFDLASLFNEAGWWQFERGNLNHVHPFLMLSLDICEKTNVPQKRDLLSDLHYALGAVASGTNDSEACLHHTKLLLQLHSQAVEDGQPPTIRLAVAHNEHGLALMMNGECENAAEKFEQAIAIYRSLPDFWYQMISIPLANLGFAYWLLSDYDRASEHLLGGLRDREAHLGYMDKDSFRTGRLLHGLGNVRFSQGNFEESENYHRRALAQYQSTLGNNHHRTADVCHRVAHHCLRHGDIGAALKLIDQALKVWGVYNQIYRPELARTTFLKARVLFKKGDDKQALKLFKEAVKLRNLIPQAKSKPEQDLGEKDFDELVMFWSR